MDSSALSLFSLIFINIECVRVWVQTHLFVSLDILYFCISVGLCTLCTYTHIYSRSACVLSVKDSSALVC